MVFRASKKHFELCTCVIPRKKYHKRMKTSPLQYILLLLVVSSIVLLSGRYAYLYIHPFVDKKLEVKQPKKMLQRADQCAESFKKDFPEYKNVENFYCITKEDGQGWVGHGGTERCKCSTFRIVGAWEKENTKYEGMKENIESYYFDLK